MTIQSDVALYFARQVRAARAQQVQADAGGYVAVAIAVEQFVVALGGLTQANHPPGFPGRFTFGPEPG